MLSEFDKLCHLKINLHTNESKAMNLLRYTLTIGAKTAAARLGRTVESW